MFNLAGQVIGIHSRIAEDMTANIHVPVDTFRQNWDRLAKGEVWGTIFPGGVPNGPYMGFQANLESKECRVAEVSPGSPAEKGGLQAEDVITRFDQYKIEAFEDLRSCLNRKRPGEVVTLQVLRGDEIVVLKIVLGKRG